jgi:hypothetical protein
VTVISLKNAEKKHVREKKARRRRYKVTAVQQRHLSFERKFGLCVRGGKLTKCDEALKAEELCCKGESFGI